MYKKKPCSGRGVEAALITEITLEPFTAQNLGYKLLYTQQRAPAIVRIHYSNKTGV